MTEEERRARYCSPTVLYCVLSSFTDRSFAVIEVPGDVCVGMAYGSKDKSMDFNTIINMAVTSGHFLGVKQLRKKWRLRLMENSFPFSLLISMWE